MEVSIFPLTYSQCMLCGVPRELRFLFHIMVDVDNDGNPKWFIACRICVDKVAEENKSAST